MSVHFSSKTDMWETPQNLFDRLHAIHHFTLDVCAVAENAKCERFFSPEEDGLKQEWTGVCWMNPPYGREIGNWVRRSVIYCRNPSYCVKTVCLLPARTDTACDYVIPYGKIEFLRGRLKFGGHKNSAPFPSAIVIFEKVAL